MPTKCTNCKRNFSEYNIWLVQALDKLVVVDLTKISITRPDIDFITDLLSSLDVYKTYIILLLEY